MTKQEIYNNVLITLKNNKITSKLEEDGIYIRFSGNNGKNEIFSNDWIKVYSFIDDSNIKESIDEIIIDGVTSTEIKFNFGKNKNGLTDELVKIGEKIKNLSNKNSIYLRSSFIDELDDVYELVFITKKIK